MLSLQRGLFVDDASERCDERRIGLDGGVFFLTFSAGFDATVESVCSVVSSMGGFSVGGGGGGDSTTSCC